MSLLRCHVSKFGIRFVKVISILLGTTNSLFYTNMSPPPSPTTGERKQYLSPDSVMINSCNQDETCSPPLQRIIRPASANSHHYIANSNVVNNNRMNSLSTENLIVDGNSTIDGLSPFSSLPLHCHSGELNFI